MWLSGLRSGLVSVKMQVRFLASLSGLSIECCCELWCRSQTQLRSGVAVAVAKASSYSSDLTPAWELLYVTGAARKSKQANKIKTKHTFTHHEKLSGYR